MGANEKQVGGSHYAMPYQHWDWAEDMQLPPLLYGATKYIVRLGKKNADDNIKAAHFLEKAIERYKVRPTFTQRGHINDTFTFVQQLPKDISIMIHRVLWGHYEHVIRELKDAAEEASEQYVNQD